MLGIEESDEWSERECRSNTRFVVRRWNAGKAFDSGCKLDAIVQRHRRTPRVADDFQKRSSVGNAPTLCGISPDVPKIYDASISDCRSFDIEWQTHCPNGCRLIAGYLDALSKKTAKSWYLQSLPMIRRHTIDIVRNP